MLKWRDCTELLKPLGQTASSFCASVSSSVNGDNNCVSRIGIHGMICRFVQKWPWVVVPDCLVQAGSNWSHCLHLSWDAEPSPAWDSHEIVAFLFLVGTEDGRLQCAWAAGLPSNWCKWLASKLRLPACVRWNLLLAPCENRATRGSTLCWKRVFLLVQSASKQALCRMLQNPTVVQNQNLFSWCALPNNSSSAYPKLSEYQAIVRIQLINAYKH